MTEIQEEITHHIFKFGYKGERVKCEPDSCSENMINFSGQCSCQYLDEDYNGTGKIKPGDTIKWSFLNLVGLDKEEDNWIVDKDTTHHSKVYSIKKSVLEDIMDNLIDMLDAGLIFVETEAEWDILEIVLDRTIEEPLTITFMGGYTGLSRNTIYRVCRKLVRLKILQRNKDLSYSLINSFGIIGYFKDQSRK